MMMLAMRNQLHTIGHSAHTSEYFLSLLTRHEIEVICDVRSSPYSQRNPQFNREVLRQQLKKVGINYAFLGKELGARSENLACYIDRKVQYNYLVDEPSFREGLRLLNIEMEKGRVALMCAERDPLTCHRTILICRELRSRDLEIKHILADGAVETNAEAERRLMQLTNITPDMLIHESECIEMAYEKQANNIAYVLPDLSKEIERNKIADENIHDRVYE
jgi:uncharacterized protein (DUF488 family)